MSHDRIRSEGIIDLPFRLVELDYRLGRVISERFRRYGLPLQPRIRIDGVGRQAQVDNLPELIDLVLQVTDRGVTLLERLLENLDGLVATSQRLRTLVQQSFQVTYRIHSLFSRSLTRANSFRTTFLVSFNDTPWKDHSFIFQRMFYKSDRFKRNVWNIHIYLCVKFARCPLLEAKITVTLMMFVRMVQSWSSISKLMSYFLECRYN